MSMEVAKSDKAPSMEGYQKTKIGLIPKDWKLCNLGEIVNKVGSGITPKGGSSVYTDFGIPLIRSQNVLRGSLNLDDVVFITTAQHDKMKNTKLLPLDVLLNITGASIGRSCVIPENFKVGNVNQHVCIIRVNGELDSFFLSELFNSNLGERQILSYQAGGNREGLNFQQIKSFFIPLPPLPEQQKIASILRTWDKAIEKTEKLLELKQQHKKGLMQLLLSGKKRFPGFNGEWKEVKLGDLGKTYTGLSGKNKDDFGKGSPYIPYMNIFSNSKIDPTNFERVQIQPGEKQYKAKYGDVFFTTSSETSDEVGMSSVLLDEIEDLHLNSFCFGFRLHNFNTILPEFARFYFRGQLFRKKIHRLAQGSTRFNLSKTELLKSSIMLPLIEEQKRIARTLELCDVPIKNLKLQLDQLKQQKTGLMQVLLTGKVRVKVD